MSTLFPMLIDGTLCEGSDEECDAVVNPATGETFGQVARASVEDIDNAIGIAERGLSEWAAVLPWERGRILIRAASILRERIDGAARTITLEQGKPFAEARAEVERSADFLEWGGEQARRLTGRIVAGRTAGARIEIEHHPIGVVAAFSPWNFPMALAAKKFAGALGAGCAIIAKGAEETPGSILAIAQALLDAGVTPAAVAVLSGDAEMISSRLLASPVVRKLSFTGSIPVGKLLAETAGRYMKPVTMELGGHAPVIVCADVDPRAAADIMVAAKFANAGQICLSPTRFFVEAPIAKAFTDRFVERAAQLRLGDGMAPETQMGPLANKRRVDAIQRLVDDASARGAKIITADQAPNNGGYFYSPTVLCGVAGDAAVLHEEPFGPVAPILPFSDEGQMLKEANGLEFGLASYIMTNDETRRRRLTDALAYGAVSVNGSLTHLPETPLGGWGDSGIGVEGGPEILAPYLRQKHIAFS